MAITRTEIARQLYRDAGYVEKAYEPSTTAKAPPSMGFGNPPPSDKVSGGDEPSIVIPKTLKKGVDLGGEVMFLKNLFVIGVSTKVGQIVFTRILFFAKSIAIPFVKPSSPNFVML